MKLFNKKYYSLSLFISSIVLIELAQLTYSKPIDANDINELDSIDVDQILQKSKELNMDSSSTVHRRVKRQYFKPNIDGSGLANERAIMLKSVRTTNSLMLGPTNENVSNSNDESIFSSTSTFADQTTISNTNNNIAITTSSSQTNETSFKKKVEISVTSLSLSLINLFDRVKGTLCNLVKIECGHNQSSIVN